MKDLILKKGGIGILVVLLVSLVVSVYYTKKIKTVITDIAPAVQQEVSGFLPITIQKGEIVAPKDTFISKDYDNGNGKVVLDTRVAEFEPSSLKATGVYVSRKYIYSYDGRKIEIYSLSNFPDVVIDEEFVSTGMNYINQHAGKFIFAIIFVGALIGIGVAVLVSTVLMHWLMALLFHVGFGYTLRINTLTYSILFLLSAFAGLSFSILINFMILVAANVAVNTVNK